MTAAAFCFASAMSAASVGTREVSGVKMREAVNVAGTELRLNGMGLRKEKVFFKAYVVGLYLEKPKRDALEAITSDETKRMVIVALRDVSRKKFLQQVEAGIRRNSGPVMPALRERLDTLKKALPDIKKGAVLDFTYVPRVGTLVRGVGRQMTIRGKDFSDALFSAWLGPNPIDGKLKLELLGG